MKLFYTEDIIRDTVRSQILTKFDELKEFKLRHPALGYLKKINGVKALAGCVIDINSEGILVVFLDSWRVNRAKDYEYFKFYGNIQGIKIKTGPLNHVITIQFFDGTNYVFQVMKRSTKHLPNQKTNVNHILSVLSGLNLHDIVNKNYKKNRREARTLSIFCLLTIVPLLYIVFVIMIKTKVPLLVGEIVSIAVVVIHLLLISCLQTRRGRRFGKEYKTIMNSYKQSNDAEDLLKKLNHMINQPKTEEDKLVYYLSLSTAQSHLGMYEEALESLSQIQDTNQKYQEVIDRQREEIESNAQRR